MHTFWVVRRLRAKQLAKERLESQGRDAMLPPRFNSQITVRSLCKVCVTATVHGQNQTRLVAVPYLTNFEPLFDGEELMVEVAKKKENQDKNTGRHCARRRRAGKEISSNNP